MSEATISILVYVLNEQENLKNCLESIIKQTLDNIEIICVDDGSIDNSREILNEYSSKYDFIKIFSQENQGYSVALNKCISESNGQYIGFLNCDTKFGDEEVLEQMFDIAIKNDANIINANIKISNNKSSDSIRINESFDCINPEQYGAPIYFYRNIFKRSFLIDNDIYFPKLKIGYGEVFFSKALSKTDNIYTLPCYMCESREIHDSFQLNSHYMQLDYLKHFQMVFDYFKDANFKNTVDDYKKLFDTFIVNQKNVFGSNTVQNDLIEVFGKDNSIIKNYIVSNPIKFSTVIYIHNSEEYLKKCLDNCLNQSFKDIEFICVNDGSNDDSENILKSYSFDPRFRIITNLNKQGKGSAFNKGLNVANGSYINFIDSEDYFSPDFFEHIYSHKNYQNNDVIIFPIFLVDNLSEKTFENGFFNLACLNGFDTNLLSSNYLIDCIFDIPRIPCNKLFNVNFLRKINVKFSENSYFYGDTLFFKTFLNSNSILFIDKHLYYKRIFNNVVNEIPNNILEEVIDDTNDIINVFKNEPCYDICKKKLLNYKIKTIRYWYSFLDEKFKRVGLNFIKKDFKSLDIQEYVYYLDSHNLLFYAMVLDLLDNDEGEMDYPKVISNLIFRLNDLSNQNDELTKVNSEDKNIHVKDKLQIINLIENNESLNRDIVSLREDISSLRKNNVSLENECASLKEENMLKISNLIDENSNLKKELVNLKRKNHDLKYNNKIMCKKFVEVDTKFNYLLNSKSWKITKPFRTVGKNLRKK